MKVSTATFHLLAVLGVRTDAFLSHNKNHRQIVSSSTSTLYAESAVSDASTDLSKPSVKNLGLLTFDLDDTLYPIANVVDAANGMCSSLNRGGTEFAERCQTTIVRLYFCCPEVIIIRPQTREYY